MTMHVHYCRQSFIEQNAILFLYIIIEWIYNNETIINEIENLRSQFQPFLKKLQLQN